MEFAIGVILGVIGLFGLFNFIRIYRKLRNHANYSDSVRRIHNHFMIAKIGVILGVLLAVPANIQGKWPFDAFTCSMYGFEGFVSGLASINLIAVMSVERYYATVKYEKKSLPTETLLSLTWLFSLMWSAVPLFKLASQYKLEKNGVTCSIDLFPSTPTDQIYMAGLVIMGFGVPILIAALYHLITMTRKGRKIGKFDTAFNKICRRLFVLEIISWSPYVVLSALPFLATRTDMNIDLNGPLVYYLSHLAPVIAKAGAALVPNVYSGF